MFTPLWTVRKCHPHLITFAITLLVSLKKNVSTYLYVITVSNNNMNIYLKLNQIITLSNKKKLQFISCTDSEDNTHVTTLIFDIKFYCMGLGMGWGVHGI